MKVAIPVQGLDLNTPVSLRFGRCQSFLFVDTENGHTEVQPNSAIDNLKDAGVQAARFVLENDVQAVIVVMIGPDAQQALQAANVTVYELKPESGRQALEYLHSNSLQALTSS